MHFVDRLQYVLLSKRDMLALSGQTQAPAPDWQSCASHFNRIRKFNRDLILLEIIDNVHWNFVAS